MLKNKIARITIVLLIIFSFLIPIVNAEDNEAESTANVTNQNTITNSAEAAVGVNSTGTAENVNATNPEGATIAENNNSSDESSIKNNDVYLSGDNITIDYAVDGNLYVLANTVTINSQIGGDAFICAKTLNVEENGYIFNNLFTIADNLNIKGVVFDLYSYSKNINLSGYVHRDIHTATKDFDFSGTIGRSAYVSADNMNFSSNTDEQNNVTSKATIYKDLNYSSKSESTIPEGVVNGSIHYNQISNTKDVKKASSYIISAIRFIVTVIIIWLLYLWLAPKFSENLKNKLSKRNILSVILSGVLMPVIFTVVFILLALLGITINIAMICILIFTLLSLLSVSTFVIAINDIVDEKRNISKKSLVFASLVICSLVFWVLGLIPYVGIVIKAISFVLGLGILVDSILPNKDNKKDDKKSKNK